MSMELAPRVPPLEDFYWQRWRGGGAAAAAAAGGDNDGSSAGEIQRDHLYTVQISTQARKVGRFNRRRSV